MGLELADEVVRMVAFAWSGVPRSAMAYGSAINLCLTKHVTVL